MEIVIVNTIVLLSPCCASSFKSGVKICCGMVYRVCKDNLNALDPSGGAWIIGELDTRVMIL